MKRLVLHIGAPKAGSSSIQNALGYFFSHPRARENKHGESVRYAALLGNGNILTGPGLLAAQNASPMKYVSSDALTNDPETLRKNLSILAHAFSKRDVVVLSNEGWAKSLDTGMTDALKAINIPIDVFFVTRAPVDWMNSSWWQWGAWSGKTLDQWVTQELPSVDYMRQMDKWRESGIVRNIRVVDISQDIIGQLLDFLEFEKGTFEYPPHLNTATNYHLLRHLLNNKNKYQRYIHAPMIEFKLNQILRLSPNPPPAVLPPRLAQTVVSSVRGNNERLIDLLDSLEQSLSEENKRKYLDETFYADIEHEDYRVALSPADNDSIIGDLIDRVLELQK